MKSFSVIGDDERQRAVANYLKQKGYRVSDVRGMQSADYLIFPMPLSKNNQQVISLLYAAKKGAVAFGGKIAEEVRQAAKEAKIELRDYLEREELAQYNAIPTAEGAMAVLLEQKQRTIWNSRVLLLGYGRIGKLLARRLQAFGARVNIAVRSTSAKALVESDGFSAIFVSDMEQMQFDVDSCINTVPSMLLTEAVLKRMPHTAFFLDLASVPGGMDQSYLHKMGMSYQWALSLPAKYAPKTAGIFVADTVLSMIAERGIKEYEN